MYIDDCSKRKKAALHSFNEIVGFFIMAIVTASVLSACGVKPEDRENRAAEALARKYHKEFEITQVYPQKFGELYYEVQAYAVDEPLVRFTASVDTEDEAVSDTYVERRVCAAISQQAAENLNELPAYYYLFVHAIGPQPIVNDAEITIRDYAALDSYNRFRIELFAVPEEQDADAFYCTLAKLYRDLDYLNGDARLFLVDEEQMEIVQAYFETNDEPGFEFFRLTKEFFSFEIPYKNGDIEINREVFAAAVKEVL